VKALPKNLIAPHKYMSTRGRVLEAYYPVGWCMPKDWMRKTKLVAYDFGKKRSHMCLIHAATVCIQVYIVLFGKVLGSWYARPILNSHELSSARLPQQAAW
jgi:hypothetical protein